MKLVVLFSSLSIENPMVNLFLASTFYFLTPFSFYWFRSKIPKKWSIHSPSFYGYTCSAVHSWKKVQKLGHWPHRYFWYLKPSGCPVLLASLSCPKPVPFTVIPKAILLINLILLRYLLAIFTLSIIVLKLQRE